MFVKLGKIQLKVSCGTGNKLKNQIMKSLFLAVTENPYFPSEKGVEKALCLSVRPLTPIVESRGTCVAFACIKHAAVEMKFAFLITREEKVTKGS